MTPHGPLPKFLIERHYQGWRTRVNQLRRELETAKPLPNIAPKVAQHGRRYKPLSLTQSRSSNAQTA